jgi:ABC-type glutathione transport system ATPase component
MELLDQDGSISLMQLTAITIVVLTLALGASGWMLKGQIQENGKLEQVVEDNQKIYDDNIAQYEQTIVDANKENEELERRSIKAEKAVAFATALKHKNARESENIRREIDEIKKSEVPGAECLDQPMPDELIECLLDYSGCGAQSDNADSDKIRLPTSFTNDGDPGAFIDW